MHQEQKTVSLKKFGKLPAHLSQCQPWEIIQVDLFGPWNFTDISGINRAIRGLSIIDPTTKWLELCPYDDKKSESIAMLVHREWFNRYPRPTHCIIDNGSEFSHKFIELLLSYGIKPVRTTIKNPQANGVVERVHQVIADCIRTMDLEQRPYDDTSPAAILSAVAWAIRTTYHSAIQTSPGQLVFGRDMIINATYLANWKFIKSKQQSQTIKNNLRENASRSDHEYRINDYVYIKTSSLRKLKQPHQGPYKIIRVIANGTVALQKSHNVTERINIRRLHPAVRPSSLGA